MVGGGEGRGGEGRGGGREGGRGGGWEGGGEGERRGGGEGRGDKKHNFKVKTVRLALKSRNNQLEGSVQQILSINIKLFYY